MYTIQNGRKIKNNSLDFREEVYGLHTCSWIMHKLHYAEVFPWKQNKHYLWRLDSEGRQKLPNF